MKLVVFAIENQQLAMPLPAVERVVQAAEITPLANAPEIVLGVINLQGQVIPVINLRKVLGFQDRELELSDYFLIARVAGQTLALLVDGVTGAIECAEEDVAQKILPGLDHVAGVAQNGDAMILLYDLRQFPALEAVQRMNISETKRVEGMETEKSPESADLRGSEENRSVIR